MRLITNSVSPTQVTDNGDHFLVENVPFVKSMHLSGGYVPEWSIQETANAWEGVPATLNHPRDNQGQPVPAETKQDTHIGAIEDSWFDGEFVRANIKLDKANLQSADAQAVKEALENGKQIHVSSQYVPKELPPREYDGQMRENVEAIANPDSVAILPNKQGKCDIQDGCGINPQMVANAEVTIPMQANQETPYEITNVSPDEIDAGPGFTDDEWNGSDAIAQMPNPSEDDDAPDVLDQTHVLVPADDEARDEKANWKLPFRTGPDAPVNTRALVAIDAALSGARGGVEGVSEDVLDDASEWTQAMLEEAPAELFGAQGDEEMEDNVLRRVGRQVVNALNLGTDSVSSGTDVPQEKVENIISEQEAVIEQLSSGEGPQSPADSSSDMDRDKLVQEITENSKLTESALEERCNDGLEAIHEDVMAANDDVEDTETMSENDDTDDDAITFNSEEEFEQYVEEIVANRVEQREEQSELEALATEIVANSADYEDTEDVLEDYPTKAALETKQDSLESGGALPGSGMAAKIE